jgi:hypothetical protein
VTVVRVVFEAVADNYNGNSQKASIDILNCGGEATGWDLYEKNRGLKREAELILLYYVPHEPLSRWIPPWAPKQKQSSLAPGFSWSLKSGVSNLRYIGCLERYALRRLSCSGFYSCPSPFP